MNEEKDNSEQKPFRKLKFKQLQSLNLTVICNHR